MPSKNFEIQINGEAHSCELARCDFNKGLYGIHDRSIDRYVGCVGRGEGRDWHGEFATPIGRQIRDLIQAGPSPEPEHLPVLGIYNSRISAARDVARIGILEYERYLKAPAVVENWGYEYWRESANHVVELGKDGRYVLLWMCARYPSTNTHVIASGTCRDTLRAVAASCTADLELDKSIVFRKLQAYQNPELLIKASTIKAQLEEALF